MKTHSEPVSFRASAQLLKQIDARREPFGISRGDWVRGVVLQALSSQDASTLASQIDALTATLGDISDETRGFKRDLARSLFLVLVHAGSLSSEDARKIVQEKLLSRVKEAP